MDQSAHDIPPAIEWHEGMMLAPQHFQEWSRREEMLRQYHAGTLSAYHWGVASMDVDEVLLVDGTFRVLELEAIMPDGLIVTHPGREEGDLEVDLGDVEDEARQHPVTVHLAVPSREEEASASGTPRRYRSVDGEPVKDRSVPDGTSVRVPRRQPQLRLLVTDTPPSSYVSFPLAKVSLEDEGFERTDYVPPHVRVAKDSSLGRLCRSLLRRVREKARSLAEQARSPSVEVGSDVEREKTRRVQMMAAGLPGLEALIQAETAHPFAVYLQLCEMAGHMAGLTDRLIPPTFDAYDHSAPRQSFVEVLSYLAHALEQGVQEAYLPIRMSRTEEGFEVAFDEAWMGRDLILGVRRKPGQTEAEVERWMERCLIGSRASMEGMRQRRILGVSRTRIERAEDLIPARDTVLVRIDSTSDFIDPGEPLVVRRGEERGTDERPLDIILYVKDRDA